MADSPMPTPASTEPVTVLDDGGDHDTFSHMVRKDALEHSQMTGEPVRALCGKVWVPRKNPDNYPVCQACIEVWERAGKAASN
jgi:hypothetical protein